MNNIPVKLDQFEGPLDLLCHLIEKNKINIYDIPISEICEQFIAFIYEGDNKNAENISDFLLMASTLLEIKSKMLLPVNEDNKEEEDPREELVKRIVEYQKYKEAAEKFEENRKTAELIFFKDESSLKDILKTETSFEVEEFLDGITTDDLLNAFKDVLNRKESRTDTIRSGFKTVQKDTFTIAEKTVYIKNLLKIRPSFSFLSLFDNDTTKPEKIVTFLSLLELIKSKFVIIKQDKLFGEIIINKSI